VNAPYNAFPFRCAANGREVTLPVACDVSYFQPDPLPLHHVREAANLSPMGFEKGFGVMEECVSGVTDTEKQDEAAKVIYPGEGGFFSQCVSQRLFRGNLSRSCSYCRHRGPRVPAAETLWIGEDG
jgi:hypothetical protein